MSDDRANLPSASGIPRLVYCNGSLRAEAQFPGEEESEAAASGTAIHAALETESDEGLRITEKDIAENLKRIETEAITAWFDTWGIKVGKTTRETRLWIRDRKTLKPTASAKPDVVVMSDCERYALVIDAKTGFLDVTPAEKNWQLRAQALAVWHNHPGVLNIRVAISHHRFSSKYDHCDYDRDALFIAEQELKFYLRLAAAEDAPRVPGSWCRYCRARGSCPQAMSFALLPKVVVPATEVAAARVALLTHDQLARLRGERSLIVAILDAVDARLKNLSAEELSAVGLRLQKNSSIRTLPKIQAVFEMLTRENLIEDAEEFRSLCEIGIGKIEDLITPRIQKKHKLKTTAEAKEMCKELLAPFVVPKPKEGSLKPLK